MDQLSPSVYLLKPSTSTKLLNLSDSAPPQQSVFGKGSASDSSSLAPKIIILCSWMSAHPTHILKYVQGYRNLYPSSRIIVIQSAPQDLFYRRASTQQQHLVPVISAILSCYSTSSDTPNILLHIFSNGGSHQARNLLLAYRTVTSGPFPPHVTVFDSCPGRATFRRSVLALSSALPSSWFVRLLLLGLIYIVLAVYWVIFVPLRLPDPIERVRQTLNSRLMMPNETRRCYIYSQADPMVGWRDVEAHAQSAVDNGFIVRCEKYDTSGHCSHVRFDGGTRYWAAVRMLWHSKEG